MVKLIRKNLNVYYYTSNFNERRLIEENLRIYIEGGEFSRSYREGKWDGYFKLYEKRFSRFRYGLLNHVKKLLENHDVHYVIENDFKPVKIKKIVYPEMWNHQKEAIIQFCQHPYGTFEIPTRGGKTKTAGELIRISDSNSVLFVVDSQMLFEQAKNDLSEHLQIPTDEIGEIREKNFDIKFITIAMIQTMQSIYNGVNRYNKTKKNEEKPLPIQRAERQELRFKKNLLIDYLQQVDFLIVDEVHEYASDDRFNLLSLAENGTKYLFMSATPDKSERPVDNIKLKRLRGETIYTVPAAELKKRGVLSKETVLLFDINHAENKNIRLFESSTYQDFEKQVIVENERRNMVIVNVTEMLRKLGMKTLVLLNKREHAWRIASITGDNVLTGDVKLKYRLSVKDAFLKEKGGVLLATNIFNKGLTLPEVEVVYNAGGGLEQSRTIQQKGRALGTTTEKKKALIIDFVDNSPYFNEHSLSRIEVYEKAVSIENIFIYQVEDKDFYSDVREFLSTWKKG